jgi:CRP/FNR family transcriptional regulator
MSVAVANESRAERTIPAVPRVKSPARPAKACTPLARAAAEPVSCSNCCLRHVCLPCGLGDGDVGQVDELTRVKRRVAKGAVLFRAGDRFETLYAVRSGSFKTVCISRNGQEKVVGLHLPGEVMGLEAISRRKQGYDAIALEDSEVCVIPYARLTELALRVPDLQHQLLRLVSGDISRDEGLMLLMGGMDAGQRIAALLLSLSKRYQKLGYSPTRFSVRMSREEIGSYLGLTLETVSRLFSRFQRDGVIAARQREVELKDTQALRALVA